MLWNGGIGLAKKYLYGGTILPKRFIEQELIPLTVENAHELIFAANNLSKNFAELIINANLGHS